MNKTTGLPELPRSWAWTTLGQVHIDNSQGIMPNQTPDQVFELYSVPSFESRKPEIVFGKEIGSNKQTVDEGAVLLCKINPRINRVWIVGNYSENKKIASTEWIPFYSQEGIEQKYLAYFMSSTTFRDFLAHNVSGVGGSLMRIKASVFVDYPFPLPPFPEQHRIVAKIEELFTKLDAGVDALKKARAQLRSYRQAVLKAAVTGELTGEWRAAHRGELEPAADLRALILRERRAKWEADQLVKMQAAGKPPKNDDWKQKYLEPAPPDTSELSELPEGWEWISLEQLAWNASYGTSAKCDYKFSGFPVLRIPNIAKGKIDVSDLKFASPQAELNEQEALKKGDLLVIRTNGSKSLIGRAALIKDELKGSYSFASYLIRFRLAGFDCLLNWISTLWHSPRVRTWIESKAATSAGQHNISLSTLNRLTLELPSLTEQQQIASEVDRLFSIADAMERAIEQSLRQAERLRQSILQQAFSGKLVPQNPNDEPASILLERIREERARNSTIAPKQKRKSSKHKQAAQTTFFS